MKIGRFKALAVFLAFTAGILTGLFLSYGGSAVLKPRGGENLGIGAIRLFESEKTEKEEITININTAKVNELVSLPGVGEITAYKIIEHRNIYGDFKTTEEIMAVKGIGTALYEKIKDLICVD